VRKRQRSSFIYFCGCDLYFFGFETGETRNFLLNGKDVLQEFCDPKDWQQLAQVRHMPLDIYIYIRHMPLDMRLPMYLICHLHPALIPPTECFEALDVRLLHEKEANNRAGTLPGVRQRITRFTAKQGARNTRHKPQAQWGVLRAA
jgi:hypothetical protein